MKRISVGMIIFFVWSLAAQAQDHIDRAVLDTCSHRCNGESTDCINCYSEATMEWQNPFEYPTQDELSSDGDDDDPYANIGFRFD